MNPHENHSIAAGALPPPGPGRCLHAPSAEGRISIAEQFGIGYLILDVVQDQKLIEKHGKAPASTSRSRSQISGATAMNEALLAGSSTSSRPACRPLLTLWDRTSGQAEREGVAALGSLPNYLITNNPKVKTLKDFSDKDRIAVPAVACFGAVCSLHCRESRPAAG
jgi:NitT/TauT family transport system substrate-binding protein